MNHTQQADLFALILTGDLSKIYDFVKDLESSASLAGYNRGHKEGYEAGRESGYNKGYDAGYSNAQEDNERDLA